MEVALLAAVVVNATVHADTVKKEILKDMCVVGCAAVQATGKVHFC